MLVSVAESGSSSLSPAAVPSSAGESSGHWTLRNGDCIEGRIGGGREGASRERIGRQGLKCALSTRH